MIRFQFEVRQFLRKDKQKVAYVNVDVYENMNESSFGIERVLFEKGLKKKSTFIDYDLNQL